VGTIEDVEMPGHVPHVVELNLCAAGQTRPAMSPKRQSRKRFMPGRFDGPLVIAVLVSGVLREAAIEHGPDLAKLDNP
jgi:hypothetical protein